MSTEDDRKDKHVGMTKTRSAVEGNTGSVAWRRSGPLKFDQFIELMHLTKLHKRLRYMYLSSANSTQRVAGFSCLFRFNLADEIKWLPRLRDAIMKRAPTILCHRKISCALIRTLITEIYP